MQKIKSALRWMFHHPVKTVGIVFAISVVCSIVSCTVGMLV